MKQRDWWRTSRLISSSKHWWSVCIALKRSIKKNFQSGINIFIQNSLYSKHHFASRRSVYVQEELYNSFSFVVPAQNLSKSHFEILLAGCFYNSAAIYFVLNQLSFCGELMWNLINTVFLFYNIGTIALQGIVTTWFSNKPVRLQNPNILVFCRYFEAAPERKPAQRHLYRVSDIVNNTTPLQWECLTCPIYPSNYTNFTT